MRTQEGRDSANRAVGVKWVAEYLRVKFQGDDKLRRLSVHGEVSGYSLSPRGYCGFKLKEGDAVLDCFAWDEDFINFPKFGNGDAVVATGSLAVYKSRSTYQLIVRQVERAGVGELHALYLERKKRLAAEGLFDEGRKRPLPSYPFRVALVASRRGKGSTDFDTLLRRSRPHIAITWCETLVQGAMAPAQIAGAIAYASTLDVDVIVVTRGGGTFEDLFGFSDERVARAVAAARHPVLSAVGHTTDTQLCDLAADAFAETPSAAVARLGAETSALRERVNEQRRRAHRAALQTAAERTRAFEAAKVRSYLADPRLFLEPRRRQVLTFDENLRAAFARAHSARALRLAAMRNRLTRFDPSQRLAEREGRLRLADAKLHRAIATRIALLGRAAETLTGPLRPAVVAAFERRRGRLAVTSAALEGKNPEAILQRGYAIVEHAGRIVRDPEGVPLGDSVTARLARGTLTARVEAKERNGNENLG